MPETRSRRLPEPVRKEVPGSVSERVHAARAGLTALLQEAERARYRRTEASDGSGAVCAWNHFENIPTFYNWNNRPR
ncbi:MAG TPA: multiple cyclophane-containing RiPP AmcA [Micromonosporaceae bacterium]|nr:multiple cyclophane-containing RiPP AmcA [Micromonosporaceae bacterium]